MAAFDAFNANGLHSVQIGRVGPGGYLVGGLNALTATDVNTYSEMYKIEGAQSVDFTIGQPVTVPSRAYNNVVANYDYGPDELQSMTMVCGQRDMLFLQAATGINMITIAGRKGHPGITSSGTRNRLVMLLTSEAKDYVSGNAPSWAHLWLFNCSVMDVSSPFTYRGERLWNVSITINPSTVTPFGVTTQSLLSLESHTHYEEVGTYRITAGTYVGNGTADDITTIQDPVSTGASAAWVETTGFAAGTVSAIAANTITLSAAPGSGKFVIVTYGFENWE